MTTTVVTLPGSFDLPATTESGREVTETWVEASHYRYPTGAQVITMVANGGSTVRYYVRLADTTGTF